MTRKAIQIEGTDIDEFLEMLESKFEISKQTTYRGKEIALSLSEVCELKGITLRTLSNWAKSGHIKVTKRGGRRLVLLKDLYECKREKGDRL